MNLQFLPLFQAEIMWCVEQFELSLQSGKLSEKKAAEIKQYIKKLKNPLTPLVKIRQIMRTNYGDYRAKMAVDEKSSKLDLSKVKITEGNTKSEKPSFIKKSAAISGSKEERAKTEFKFSFNIKQ